MKIIYLNTDIMSATGRHAIEVNFEFENETWISHYFTGLRLMPFVGIFVLCILRTCNVLVVASSITSWSHISYRRNPDFSEPTKNSNCRMPVCPASLFFRRAKFRYVNEQRSFNCFLLSVSMITFFT